MKNSDFKNFFETLYKQIHIQTGEKPPQDFNGFLAYITQQVGLSDLVKNNYKSLFGKELDLSNTKIISYIIETGAPTFLERELDLIISEFNVTYNNSKSKDISRINERIFEQNYDGKPALKNTLDQFYSLDNLETKLNQLEELKEGTKSEKKEHIKDYISLSIEEINEALKQYTTHEDYFVQDMKSFSTYISKLKKLEIDYKNIENIESTLKSKINDYIEIKLKQQEITLNNLSKKDIEKTEEEKFASKIYESANEVFDGIKIQFNGLYLDKNEISFFKKYDQLNYSIPKDQEEIHLKSII